MARFIHAADIHLDSPLLKLDAYQGAPVAEIRGATRRALTRLIDSAISEAVDFLLIAGDLYDGDWRDQQTGLFFVAQATRLIQHGIPLFVIRGNHDATNVMTQSLPLPANPDGSPVLLSDQKADTIRLENLGVSIHGRSFGQRAVTENLVLSYPAADSGLFNIGMLHTSLQGLEGHDTYAPCSPQMLADKEYDYWALGHIHHRGDHQLPGAAPIVFSGNIQGRHTREIGPKGCYLVDTGHDRSVGQVTKTFMPLDVVRWEMIAIDASKHDCVDSILDEAKLLLDQQWVESTDSTLVVRIRISGSTELHGELVRNRAKHEAHLQALAMDTAGHAVWIESLRIRTSLPQKALERIDDGPLHSVLQVLRKLEDAPLEHVAVQTSYHNLVKKLPDLVAVPDLSSLIDEARAALIHRLRPQQGN